MRSQNTGSGILSAPSRKQNIMKSSLKSKLLILISIIVVFYCFCKSKDNEPPVVEIILNPQGKVVCNIVEISAIADDNKGVSKIEILLDNQVIQTADDSFCTYNWNTRSHPDNSVHKIFAKAYDLEENEGFSDTIEVTVFNNLDNTEIFIWLVDRLDKFYDSTVNDSVDCAYWIERLLIANGYSCDRLTFLPPDLSSYKIGFVTLGWERC